MAADHLSVSNPGLTADADAPVWQRSLQLQTQAAAVGFDWPDANQALAKLEEEVAEVRHEIDTAGGSIRIGEEIGDVLFALLSLARHAGIDLEQALDGTNRRFEARFERLQALAAEAGQDLRAWSLTESLQAWQQAKREVAAGHAAPDGSSAPD